MVFPWRKRNKTNICAFPLASLDTVLCEDILREVKAGKMTTLGYAGVSQSVYRNDPQSSSMSLVSLSFFLVPILINFPAESVKFEEECTSRARSNEAWRAEEVGKMVADASFSAVITI